MFLFIVSPKVALFMAVFGLIEGVWWWFCIMVVLCCGGFVLCCGGFKIIPLMDNLSGMVAPS